jgi:predicted metal-dependent phosphoesterase TrpH
MRCDLHVHSAHSGRVTLPLLRRFGNECYSEPGAVYEQARRRGMDLVTLTDHDSIEGGLAIAHLPGTFLSEEVSCELGGERELHLGVFGLTETQHDGIQRRRRDPEALFAWLSEQGLPFCVNHLFSALTGRREPGDFRLALDHAPLLEARNGMMPATTNALAAEAARAAGIPCVGGSDAHTLASVAGAWTVADGAGTKEDFLDALRRGRTRAEGRSGSWSRLTGDVSRIAAGWYRDFARHALDGPREAAAFAALVAAAPLLPLLPAITALVYAREVRFGPAWARRLRTREHGPRAVQPAAAGATGALG